MMILETVLSDRYVCQISCFSPQVKYVGAFLMLGATLRDVFTPFHLGLAVPLYHDIGSKQLLQTLHSNGFCASYAEVRRYQTSIAHHEIKKFKMLSMFLLV